MIKDFWSRLWQRQHVLWIKGIKKFNWRNFIELPYSLNVNILQSSCVMSEDEMLRRQRCHCASPHRLITTRNLPVLEQRIALKSCRPKTLTSEKLVSKVLINASCRIIINRHCPDDAFMSDWRNWAPSYATIRRHVTCLFAIVRR